MFILILYIVICVCDWQLMKKIQGTWAPLSRTTQIPSCCCPRCLQCYPRLAKPGCLRSQLACSSRSVYGLSLLFHHCQQSRKSVHNSDFAVSKETLQIFIHQTTAVHLTRHLRFHKNVSSLCYKRENCIYNTYKEDNKTECRIKLINTEDSMCWISSLLTLDLLISALQSTHHCLRSLSTSSSLTFITPLFPSSFALTLLYVSLHLILFYFP